jgi:hypothetical protein
MTIAEKLFVTIGFVLSCGMCFHWVVEGLVSGNTLKTLTTSYAYILPGFTTALFSGTALVRGKVPLLLGIVGWITLLANGGMLWLLVYISYLGGNEDLGIIGLPYAIVFGPVFLFAMAKFLVTLAIQIFNLSQRPNSNRLDRHR